MTNILLAEQRHTVASLGRTLDVDADIIAELVRAYPHLALLTENELAVIPKRQRDLLNERLQGRLINSFVHLPTLIRSEDISRQSVGALIRSVEGDASEINDGLLSAKYEQTLSATVRNYLDRALQDLEPVTLTSDSLEGQPPIWLIERVLQKLQQTPELASQFYINREVDAIHCIPKQAVIRRRDEAMSKLQSGEVTCLDSKAFAAEFSQLYASHAEAVQFLDNVPHTSLIYEYAVSDEWLAAIRDDACRDLDEVGFVDWETKLRRPIPQEVKYGVVKSVTRLITETYGSETLRIQQYVLTSSKYTLERDVLFDFAKAQAVEQWQAMKETPDKDTKFQLSDLLAAIPPEQTLLRDLAQDNSVEPLLLERYSTEVSILESQNETEFGAFWNERVLVRVHTYSDGLEGVEEEKLRGQLAELLTAYLQKELLPDALAKAQLQGLVRSKKTRKNVQKLETALKAGKKDLGGVQSSLDKFGKKQDVQGVDDTSSAESKKIMVGDMIRRLQKPKTEGPLLFLTLVLVLFAKYQPGVVYATGKFAPKLLKQLKPKLSAEEYERLENWKELAKTGALSSSDKEAMRQMVALG